MDKNRTDEDAQRPFGGASATLVLNSNVHGGCGVCPATKAADSFRRLALCSSYGDQSDALKQSPGQDPGRLPALRYTLTWRWRGCLCWARYAFIERHWGLLGLVDLVLRNYPFYAMQVPSELAALGHVLAEHRPARALEIGTAKGGTLFFLTRLASPHATIVSVDLHGGMFGGGYGAIRKLVYQRFARSRQRLHLLQRDSHTEETLRRVKKMFEGLPLDYLFIDGDHSYDGVKRDFEMYGPLVRQGGLIVIHDIVEGPSEAVGGVPQFWREIKSQFRHAELINDPLQGGHGIGVLFL